MRPHHSLALAAVIALGCNAARSDNPLLYGRSIPRAGVHAVARAEHGGVVKAVGDATVEVVVEPTGRARVYLRDGVAQRANPRAARGTIAAQTDGGPRVFAELRADPSSGALVAHLPPPSGARTDYDVDLAFDGRAVRTGVAVLAGGTDATLASSRAMGDLPTTPREDVEAPPHQDTPGAAIGGGPVAP